MARPYSTRFMSGYGSNRREEYTVPEGYRAVVRGMSLLIWAGTIDSDIRVYAHGILQYYHVETGSSIQFMTEARWTLYERETLAIELRGRDASYSLDGFLLIDPDGEPDDADNTITPIATARPTPLPAA